MDKPVCKICGKKHWSHEDHVFPDEVVKVSSPDKIESKPEKKKGFDRVAYQREYMRKRRERKDI